ncbi:hypothetical protein [Flexivirga caeni]|uniref:AbiEi antitoxin C-terminal domain-containing protein n=1 Tax=Flexivirga caeni TaxID=2294115 RepID=A0A3M9MJF1_9MICO|nr:hypothetical protein [Flexivirga caeni]RNI25307.1 hypothetical protein EFY87_01350 [Flexivirga caeni]
MQRSPGQPTVLPEDAVRPYAKQRDAHVESLRAGLHLVTKDRLPRNEVRPFTKLRRGAYAYDGQQLEEADALILLACAVEAKAQTPPVFAQGTAAAIWGFPVVGRIPHRVEDVVPPDSHGRAPQARRRRTSIDADYVIIGGLRVTTCERTVIDHARYAPLESAIAMIDSAIRCGVTARRALLAELESLPKGTRGCRMATLAVYLADPKAESVLESLSRARMFQLGLPRPQLQVEFTDRRGLVGRVDFYWPQLEIVGESDGMSKYVAAEGVSAREAVDVVLREKERELRLRRSNGVRDVLRWGWNDALRPGLLFEVLAAGGVRPVLDGGWSLPDGPLPRTAFAERGTYPPSGVERRP